MGDDVDAEQQVCHGVGGDAVPDVFGADHEPGDEAEPDEGGEFFGVVQDGEQRAEDDGSAVFALTCDAVLHFTFACSPVGARRYNAWY